MAGSRGAPAITFPNSAATHPLKWRIDWRHPEVCASLKWSIFRNLAEADLFCGNKPSVQGSKTCRGPEDDTTGDHRGAD